MDRLRRAALQDARGREGPGEPPEPPRASPPHAGARPESRGAGELALEGAQLAREPDSACPGDTDYLAAVYPDPASKRVLIELGMLAEGHNCGGGGQVYAVVPLP